MEYRIIVVVLMLCVSAWHANAAVNCTAAGRFADPADTTCKNYTLCVASGSTFLGYNYVCPSTSLFSPTLRQCTSEYTCNVTDSSTTTSDCTADGYFADPNSMDCTTYIECVLIDDTFTETVYTCSDGTYFDPSTTFCEADYACTFSCTSAGRYADPSDSACQDYIYCVLLSNGTYTQYTYTCPSTSLFNPTTSMCTSNYTCTD